mmetsp:Transcript_24623/g.68624  ORF Transcript_24623/g.68624 Transcript_24623/m.68624 type:complete len:245 (+) Transcript_24623:165-899(+)
MSRPGQRETMRSIKPKTSSEDSTTWPLRRQTSLTVPIASAAVTCPTLTTRPSSKSAFGCRLLTLPRSSHRNSHSSRTRPLKKRNSRRQCVCSSPATLHRQLQLAPKAVRVRHLHWARLHLGVRRRCQAGNSGLTLTTRALMAPSPWRIFWPRRPLLATAANSIMVHLMALRLPGRVKPPQRSGPCKIPSSATSAFRPVRLRTAASFWRQHRQQQALSAVARPGKMRSSMAPGPCETCSMRPRGQ